MPKNNKMLLKLEGFKYATSLDLNMGYFYIQINKNTIIICKIILSWVKYRYKHLPMVFINSSDIFKQRINDLFQGFEFIRVYIPSRKLEIISNRLEINWA